MKRYLFLCLILITISLYAIDDNAGEAGWQFLKIPNSPALAGMANTGEMLSTSPLNLLNHPAAFDWSRGKYVAASQTIWFMDTNMYNIAYRNVMFDKSFGLGMRYMDYGRIEQRTYNGAHTGYYYPMDFNFLLNYAQKITPELILGVSGSIIYEKIDDASALGTFVDLGAVYHTPLDNVSFDVAFKHIGSSGKMVNEKIKLPFTTEIGINAPVDFLDYKFSPSMKLVYMNDHDDILPMIGVDFNLYNILSFRAGYKFNYNEEDLSGGIGILYNNISVDYAYINSKIEGLSVIGIGYKF